MYPNVETELCRGDSRIARGQYIYQRGVKMKRIIYIIMMLYYTIMCADLFVEFLPMTINIFSPPHFYIFWFGVHGYTIGNYIVFYAIIVCILLFTTLAHFYKGSFKIIAIICLCIIALGNILVIFDGPTFAFCIILIALTFYISKEKEYIIEETA